MSWDMVDFELNYEVRKAQVTFTRDVPAIMVGDEKLGPFVEGQTTTVRYYQARQMVLSGIAEPMEREKITKSLQSLFLEETQNSSIQRTESEYFLMEIRELLDFLIKYGNKQAFLAASQTIEPMFRNIVRLRLSKIFKVLTLSASERLNATAGLTNSERWLDRMLYKAVERWMSFFLKEEVGK